MPNITSLTLMAGTRPLSVAHQQKLLMRSNQRCHQVTKSKGGLWQVTKCRGGWGEVTKSHVTKFGLRQPIAGCVDPGRGLSAIDLTELTEKTHAQHRSAVILPGHRPPLEKTRNIPKPLLASETLLGDEPSHCEEPNARDFSGGVRDPFEEVREREVRKDPSETKSQYVPSQAIHGGCKFL
ncbi:hypothetical protein PSTG_04984 [Puccinia striiformis f. sp. tritici PST-78]|uniref:Uncharacterized protein n=1 Tax=Puccinia striiformis f. sp. tritici PST-78 TaxID=1165861 RepID=A0A0L0VS81_9BASI|nr:hypothetical protein PSTG_04984 [Puccinia striiformis f. sp. tritici PST-78]